MQKKIKIKDGEVCFTEDIFGGIEQAKLTIAHDELEDYEISLDIEGNVSLDEFIKIDKSNEVKFDISAFRTGNMEISENEPEPADEDVTALTQGLQQIQRKDMPPIPGEGGLKTTADKTHYKRLVENPDSQPAKYRRLIRNEGRITRKKLDRWTERQGFDPKGGSHNASLLMLERIGEIDRRGRGDNQVIIWTGE